ncbi:uncharacterized protein LOC129749390 [Uranotaenia lowii]|uniref:uncharacterized protein LOC129749390 n=1 Tax=Uranotaenia lowii TaxID=190385 RepID=UPI0024796D4F|nr:uncharacterized protein LOC129749390 [Uranotaenia lowii]
MLKSSCISVFIVILGLLLNEGHCLSCDTCHSTASWADCEKVAQSVECDPINIQGTLLYWGKKNPTLTTAALNADLTRFKCFQLDLTQEGEDQHFMKGCTFEQTDLCSGWDEGVKVKNCGAISYWLVTVLIIVIILVAIGVAILCFFYVRYKRVADGGFVV